MMAMLVVFFRRALSSVQRLIGVKLVTTTAYLNCRIAAKALMSAVQHADTFHTGQQFHPVCSEQENEDARGKWEKPVPGKRTNASKVLGLVVHEFGNEFDQPLKTIGHVACPTLRGTPGEEQHQKHDSIRKQSRRQRVGPVEVLAWLRAVVGFTRYGDHRQRNRCT